MKGSSGGWALCGGSRQPVAARPGVPACARPPARPRSYLQRLLIFQLPLEQQLLIRNRHT